VTTLAARLPTGRAGQALAVALTLLAALALWEAVAAPLLGWYDSRRDDVREMRALAARMEVRAASLPALRREAALVARSGPARSALLPGRTDAIAAADLQGRIQDMAQGAGTALSSTEALPARPVGAYRRIALRISFNATLPVLVHLLQSLDGSSPRMLVDDLQLHASPIVMAQNRAASPPLDATMTVIAFRAGGGGEGESGDEGAGP
jgi:general secretion pathway protein M